MSGIGKVLLIGGAGFVAYQVWKGQAATLGAAVAPASAGGIQPAVTPAPTPPMFNPSTTAALILNKAGSSFTMGSPDEWGYYWNEARGPNSAPDPISDLGFTQETRLQKMSFPEYWALAQSKGFSGLAGLSGLLGITRGVGYVRAPGRLALMELQ